LPGRRARCLVGTSFPRLDGAFDFICFREKELGAELSDTVIATGSGRIAARSPLHTTTTTISTHGRDASLVDSQPRGSRGLGPTLLDCRCAGYLRTTCVYKYTSNDINIIPWRILIEGPVVDDNVDTNVVERSTSPYNQGGCWRFQFHPATDASAAGRYCHIRVRIYL
jgi:hypothetical protein